jgi:DNA-binding IclR family transcriptional regulator
LATDGAHSQAVGSTRAVDRALLLLAAVTDGPDGSTLTELARETGLAASTASRLLATLDRRGFVRRSPDGRYHAGTRLVQIAAATLRQERIYELAGPHLHELARETGETANLGVPIDDDRVLYLRQVASPQVVHTAIWTGRTIPAQGTAIGSALRGLARDSGWISMRDAFEPDVSAAAAAVRGPDGDIVGALSIIAPTYRTSDEDLASFGRALARHANALSLALGAAPEVLA